MITPSHPVRQHILDAARPIILGKGFTATGLNEILLAAAVPKGSFYHYFKSKEAFGEALLETYFNDYLQRLDVLLQTPGQSAAQRLMAYWSLWRSEQGGEQPDSQCLVVKLGGEVSDLSEAMRTALQRGAESVVKRLAACLQEGAEEGSLPRLADPTTLARALYQMWLGATLLTKINRHPGPLDSALATTCQLLQQNSSN